MIAQPPPSTAAAPPPGLTIGRRRIPVVLPRRSDPRLRLAAVLLTVQLLGQTVLGFKLSIAQILVSIGTAALIELAVTFHREQALVWPASAMLTGNSIALLLRATGTEHGDWWSLNGAHWFALAVVLALLSKYLIRPGGRHVFNPSNVALVWVLLVVGVDQVFPQYLYWGPLEWPVATAVGVILLGAGWVLRPLGMLPMAVSFLASFGALIGVFAAMGRSFFAIWHPTAITGGFYWVNLVLSPEVLIFVFFMMSDPQTAPRSPRGRVVFGVLTALVAAALVYPQQTEFGAKVGILASLTVTSTLVPALERRRSASTEALPAPAGGLRRGLVAPARMAVAIVAIAAPINTIGLAGDEQLILLERGLSGDPDPQ